MWLLLSLPAVAQAPDTYESMLVSVKASDPAVDFVQLRQRFVESAGYDPYTVDEATEKAMWTALESKDYAGALKAVDSLLGDNYLNLKAHLGGYGACKALGDEARMKHHDYVLTGNLKVIFASGDGKSARTAFHVISLAEEFDVLSLLELKRVGQELLQENGHHYDVLTARRENGQEVRVYFNVDPIFAWMEKNLR
ncbi:MAG: DUF4919 domain-containing protein [Candidatus Eremiobacterota bacterium]